MIKKLGVFTISCWTIILAGTGIRLLQYLYNRSLWADEAAVALNLLERGFVDLLKPLDSSQSAPPLFLWIEKAIILIAGPSDLSIRFLPFISSLISIYLFYVFLKQIRVSRNTLLMSLLLFAVLPVLIFYSSMLKQYSTDVLIFLCMLTLTRTTIIPNGRKRTVFLSIAGAIAIFFTHTAIIFLPAIWLSEWIRKRERSKAQFLTVGFVWCTAALIFYFLFVSDHPARSYMLKFWEPHFMPSNPFKVEFWDWLVFKAYSVFDSSLEFNAYVRTWGIPYLCFLLGIYSFLRKRNHPDLVLLTLPIVIHMLFSAFHLYPFFSRLILYLFPLFIILVTEGISFVIDRFGRFRNIIFLLIFSLLALNLAWTCKEQIPKPWMEAKANLKFMAGEYRDSDYVVVSSPAHLSLQYYRNIGLTDVQATQVISLIEERFDYQSIIPDTESRAWLLVGHWGLQIEKDREDQMVQYLMNKGRLILHNLEYGCSVYLFEFT